MSAEQYEKPAITEIVDDPGAQLHAVPVHAAAVVAAVAAAATGTWVVALTQAGKEHKIPKIRPDRLKRPIRKRPIKKTEVEIPLVTVRADAA